MKIAIDLNDVIRDYTNNFISVYLINYNREFDTDGFEVWTNDMETLLPFKTTRQYEKFVYEDFTYELYSKCGTCTNKTKILLSKFVSDMHDEGNEIMIVSPMEFGSSLGYTYLFIGNLGSGIREVYLPIDSSSIWDKCDVLITANPLFLNSVPENKKVVKISADYNKDIKCEHEYRNIDAFINDKENITKLG